MKKFLVLIILVILPQSVYSQWEQRAAKFTHTSHVYKDGKLYIGRTNGLTILDMATKKSKHFSTVNSALPGNYINAFVEMPDKSYLIATDHGLAVLENDIITTDKPICKDYPDNESRNIVQDVKGSLWSFSAHKIHRYKDNKWVSYDLGDYIKSAIGISKLYCFDKEVWFISNEIKASGIEYYYSSSAKYNYHIGILRDTGVVKLFKNSNDYPYSQNSMSLAQINQGILLWNGDSTYLYRNNKWEKSALLDQDTVNRAYIIGEFLDDKKGNIWYSMKDWFNDGYPVSFNKFTGKITEYIKDKNRERFMIIDTMNNGEIFFLKFKGLCLNINNKWKAIYPSDYGFTDYTVFNGPFKIEDKYYTTVLFNNMDMEQNGLQRGTIVCLDDSSKITLDDKFFPYSTINSFGITKDQKGMFHGALFDEFLSYEADSAFVPLGTQISPPEIKTAKDGKVFNNHWSDIVTWYRNDLIYLNMGYPTFKVNRIIDFDISGDLVVALGYYEYAKDSLTSFVSVYNTSNGKLDKYDKFNSCMPDFFRVDMGGYLVDKDTIPVCLTVDDKSNIWIKTSASLIKFKEGIGAYFALFKNRFGIFNYYFDKTSNQILVYNYKDTLVFYDIIKNKWDSSALADSHIKGKLSGIKSIKKLLDNKVYVFDDLGYLYQYDGDGKFSQIDLQIPGRDNFGTPVNDFCLDANYYLHFGTYSGIFTNKYLFNCGAGYFNYEDFTNSSDIIFNEKAKVEKAAIQLTEPKPFDLSSVFYDKPMVVSGGFSTEFSFRFFNGFNKEPDGSPVGADGITFMIQGNSPNEVGNGGGGLGYDGIPNSLVIEYDSFKNNTFDDPDGSHIGVFSNGKNAISAKHNGKSDHGTTSFIPTLKADSTIYYSKIEYNYDSKKLQIWFDTTRNFKNLVIEYNSLDISALLNLIEGKKAFVGFTSATGESYQTTELLSWSFCPSYSLPVIASVKDADLSELSDEIIYPNPARDYIEINLGAFNPTLKRGVDEYSDIQIIDMLGEIVLTVEQTSPSVQRLDISNLASGMYFIKIGNKVEKFVKI